MTTPLMPIATAVWLIDNTTLTFDQIADFCKIHALEVQAIADGEASIGVIGRDPVSAGELLLEEIVRCQGNTISRLVFNAQAQVRPKKKSKYTPISKRQDKPNAILWIVKNYPKVSDPDIIRLLGTTKNTITAIRDGSHRNIKEITQKDPVMLGLCKQSELNEMLEKYQEAEEA